MAEVVPLRPNALEAAPDWLRRLIAEGALKGVVLMTIAPDTTVGSRIFGDVRRFDLAYMGACLTERALTNG